MLTRKPMKRRPAYQERLERSAKGRAAIDSVVAAADARGWVGCGDLTSAALRRSPFFKNLPDARRFNLCFVVAESGCWQWIASRKSEEGYGQFRFRRSNWNAHRVAYELFVGPIPDGLTLDHTCRNKGCVNPGHLEPVTGAENTRRYGATITHCPEGHPYDTANTITKKNGRRDCRCCHNKRTGIATRIRNRRPVAAGTVAVLRERSGGLCEMRLHGCIGAATDPAHRIGRKAGGRPNDDLDTPANLIYACRRCHEWCHARPAEARDLGLMLLEHQDPTAEPVAYQNAGWVLLDDAGGLRPAYLTRSGGYSDHPDDGAA